MKKLLLAFLLISTAANAQLTSLTTYVGNRVFTNTTKQVSATGTKEAILAFANNPFISATYPVTTTSYVSASTYYGDGSHLTGISGGGGSASPSSPVGSIQYNSAGLFAGSSNLVVSSTSPFIVSLTGQLVPNTISSTGIASVTAVYAPVGQFGGTVMSTTGVLNLRQLAVGSASNGLNIENPSGQSAGRFVLDSTGTGANLIINNGGFSNQLVIGTLGRIGIGKSASSALEVSGTTSSTNIITGGLLTAANVSSTGNITASGISVTTLNANTVSLTNLTVTGVFSGTVVTYTTNVTQVFNVTTTLGTLDEATVSQTASGVTSLTTTSATVFNLTLTGNTSISLVGTPVSTYSRGVNIFTKQGGTSGTYALGWNIPCKWSAGYTPSPTQGIGAMDDWFVTTFDQGTTYHCYQNGAGMQ